MAARSNVAEPSRPLVEADAEAALPRRGTGPRSWEIPPSLTHYPRPFPGGGLKSIAQSTALSRLDRPGAQLVVPEDERPAVGRGDDVDGAVAVQIRRRHIRTGAGTVVDQLGHKLRATRSLLVAHGAEHV